MYRFFHTRISAGMVLCPGSVQHSHRGIRGAARSDVATSSKKISGRTCTLLNSTFVFVNPEFKSSCRRLSASTAICRLQLQLKPRLAHVRAGRP